MTLSINGCLHQPQLTQIIFHLNNQVCGVQMKKLTLALLGAFAISIPSYAQAGGIGTIIDTIQVLQDINDMLGSNSNDDGYYDDGYYNNDGYDDRYSGYGYPPQRPDYGYRHRPSYPSQEPGDGYGFPRHRAGYPDGPQGRMGQPETEKRVGHDGIIGRPERHGSMGNPQGGPDGQDKRMDRPGYQGDQDGNRNGRPSIRDRGSDRYQEHHPDSRREGLFDSNGRSSERQHHERPFGNRHTQDHPRGIFGDRNGSHEGMFGSRNRRDSRGGFFDRGHRQSRGGMFGGNPHRRHDNFGGGHHNRHGISGGRHHRTHRI